MFDIAEPIRRFILAVRVSICVALQRADGSTQPALMAITAIERALGRATLQVS